MPVPIILGVIAAGTALYGTVKGVKGAIDHNDANDTNQNAQSMVDTANRKVDEHREATNAVLKDYGGRKLRAFNGIIADFIDTFGRLKNVDTIHTPELDNLNLGDFSTVSLDGLRNDFALLKSSGLGLGAGIGGGAALAFGAYNGTMLLAAASTGTAIAELSGVAATNATLAWLGGGSLAAGGGGMALGRMVLGGIVAGPALAIFGHIVGNKGEEALNNARSNLEQAKSIHSQAQLMISKLEAIEKISTMANNIFSTISGHLRHAIHDLKKIVDSEGENYQALSSESRETVFRSVKFAQLIKAMIDTPIMDQDGNLVLATEKRLQEIEGSLA
jgi:hypothetical protein